jgi:tRNA (cytidine/uridine-2'-O-)-methyltransferase
VNSGSAGEELGIVLVEPQIPPNTGNVARLCAALALPLHLVGPLGFEISDRQLKRAGLDYWPFVDVRIHPEVERFFEPIPADRLHLFSKQATIRYTDVAYRSGDYLVFGSETSGLPVWLKERFAQRLRAIPMRTSRVRSLNLSSAVAVATYEAVRQIGLFRAG